MLLGGVRLSATQALQWGLVDELAESADLLNTAKAHTEAAVASDPNHLVAIKKLIREAQA